MNSLTEENYLKAIYKLLGNREVVYTNDLAAHLQTRAASVTNMLRKLAVKKMIHYRRYKGVSLTRDGKRVALNVIRKHRLWEMFLVQKLGFRWDEVHEVAEQLEHIRSEKLVREVEKVLHYPKFDPHGDPIPDEHGNLSLKRSVLLSGLEPNDTCRMTGVADHSDTFLRYLHDQGLSPGKSIRVLQVMDYDRSLRISVNGKNIYISHEVAKHILVAGK